MKGLRFVIDTLNILMIVIIFVMIILLLSTRYSNNSINAYESFASHVKATASSDIDSLLNIPPRGKTNSFPDSEAHIFHEKQDKYGIAQCTYSGYTPILTCSYDSKI